ncbi:hypothetical protein SLA2020_201910 [Shorea laevis]
MPISSFPIATYSKLRYLLPIPVNSTTTPNFHTRLTELTPSHLSSSFLPPFLITNSIVTVTFHPCKGTFTICATCNRFELKKPHVNSGTIDYVNHGKTTLIATLTMALGSMGNNTPKEYELTLPLRNMLMVLTLSLWSTRLIVVIMPMWTTLVMPIMSRT